MIPLFNLLLVDEVSLLQKKDRKEITSATGSVQILELVLARLFVNTLVFQAGNSGCEELLCLLQEDQATNLSPLQNLNAMSGQSENAEMALGRSTTSKKAGSCRQRSQCTRY